MVQSLLDYGLIDGDHVNTITSFTYDVLIVAVTMLFLNVTLNLEPCQGLSGHTKMFSVQYH